MTLEGAYPGGPTVVTCNACPRAIEVKGRSEQRAIVHAEIEGWRFPDHTDRCYCPACSDALDIEVTG